MATLSQGASAAPMPRITGRKGMVDRYFYLFASLLIAGIVVWGFSHTVVGNLIHPAVPRPLLLWFHASAFTGWVAFYIFQSALVRTHNVKLHRTVGWFGAALGTFMVILGIWVSIVMGRFDTNVLHEPGSAEFLIVPWYDMLAFGTLFGLAILWRKKPELHRRLLFIATCCLLDAAFGRVDYIYFHALFFVCLDGVIALGIVRDLLVDRRVHKVYLAVMPPLMVAQYVVAHTWQTGAGWWVRIAHSVLG
jgi:hypothetical protein